MFSLNFEPRKIFNHIKIYENLYIGTAEWAFWDPPWNQDNITAKCLDLLSKYLTEEIFPNDLKKTRSKTCIFEKKIRKKQLPTCKYTSKHSKNLQNAFCKSDE